MKSSLSRQEFLHSEMADILRSQLQAMVDDPQYNTAYRYLDGAEFISKNMEYMSNHPTMAHEQYVSNLKLKLKSVTK